MRTRLGVKQTEHGECATETGQHTLVVNVPVAWSDHSIVDPNGTGQHAI